MRKRKLKARTVFSDIERNLATVRDFVRVYDFDTNRVTSVPASELAPGMVLAHIQGIHGKVWCFPPQLKPSEFRHLPFPEDIRDYLRKIKAALDEVYPKTLEEWEEGFRRDASPEREIAYWLYFADVYARLTAPGHPLGTTKERRIAVCRILGSCGVSPEDRVLLIAEREPLSRDEAVQVIAEFFGTNAPREDHSP